MRRGLGQPVEIAATLSTLSNVRLHEGDAQKGARVRGGGVGEIFRKLGDEIGEAIGLLHLGEICLDIADDEQARRHFEQCLTIARAIKYQGLESDCERMIG